MSVRLSLSRRELLLVHEALEYVGRRVREPEDAKRAATVRMRLETAITRGRAGERLTFDDEHLRVLRTMIDSYVAEIDRPFSDISNRARVAYLRAIDKRIRRAQSWTGRLLGFLYRS